MATIAQSDAVNPKYQNASSMDCGPLSMSKYVFWLLYAGNFVSLHWWELGCSIIRIHFPTAGLDKIVSSAVNGLVSDVERDVSSHWCVVGRMIKNSIKGWSLSASLADRWFQFSSGFRDIPIGSHSHVNLFSFVKVMTTLILITIDWMILAWLWSVWWFCPREKCLLTVEEMPAGV